MEYRILGPLEVLDEGSSVTLGTLKERAVLAVLLLHANELVSRERLIDDLWGAAPPPTARKAISVYLSKLRKTLARNGDDPIAAIAGGYRFTVDSERLDSARAQRLVADAGERIAAGDVDAAGRLLRDALALWRGATVAGIDLESQGRDEVARLDELRLAALMDRIDCDLAQGRHQQVVGELQVLIGEHPLRERLRAQHMLALYRSDRQAEALEAFQQARRAFVDELGIDPSESLQRLQQAILRHDPALEAPGGTARANEAATPTAAARSRTRRRALPRRRILAGALVLAAVAAALAAVLASRDGGSTPPATRVSSVAPNTVAILDPATGALIADIGAGPKPGLMARVGDRLWIVAQGSRGGIQPYDLRFRQETPPFPAGATPDAIAADGTGNAWVSQRKPVVTWIGHPRSYEADHPYTVPAVTTQDVRVALPGAGAEAVGGGYLWVISDLAGRAGHSVSLVDLRRRRLVSTIPLDRQTTALAYGYGAAWIGTYDPRHSTAWLSRVAPGSNQVRSLELGAGVGAGPLSVAVGAGGVWVVTSRGDLLRIDPTTERIVRRIAMAALQPTLVAVGAGAVWTADHATYGVSRIDPRTNTVSRTIPLGRYSAVPCGITATPDAVFVSFGDTGCGRGAA